jgi:hypothetical protein
MEDAYTVPVMLARSHRCSVLQKIARRSSKISRTKTTRTRMVLSTVCNNQARNKIAQQNPSDVDDDDDDDVDSSNDKQQQQ